MILWRFLCFQLTDAALHCDGLYHILPVCIVYSRGNAKDISWVSNLFNFLYGTKLLPSRKYCRRWWGNWNFFSTCFRDKAYCNSKASTLFPSDFQSVISLFMLVFGFKLLVSCFEVPLQFCKIFVDKPRHFSWSYLELFGFFRSYLELFRAIWIHLVPFGAIWSICSHLNLFWDIES